MATPYLMQFDAKKIQVCFKTGLDPAEMIQSHTENQIIGINKVLYRCDNFNAFCSSKGYKYQVY